jgi:hypothetical protein
MPSQATSGWANVACNAPTQDKMRAPKYQNPSDAKEILVRVYFPDENI